MTRDMAVAPLGAITCFERLRDSLRKSAVGTSVLVGVLREVARGGGFTGRSEITQALGVGSATVSRAINELLDLDLVEPGRLRPTAGRPVIGLALSDKRYASIGIRVSDLDSGAVELAGAVTALDGRTLAYEACPVRMPRVVSKRLDALVEQVSAFALVLVERCQRRNRLEVLGVGVQFGGHVHEGTVLVSVNIEEVSKLAIEQRLADALGLPVVVENDLTALAVLDALFDPFQGTEEMSEDSQLKPVPVPSLAVVGVFDRGIGAGLVVGGRAYRGAHGLASEIGHVPVDLQTTLPPCRCKRLGCLEAVSTPARIRLALTALGVEGQGPTDQLVASSEELPADLRSAALSVFERAGRGLGRGLGMLTNFFDPGKIVLLLDPQLEKTRGDLVAAYYDAMKEERLRAVFSPFANPNLDPYHFGHDDLARLHAEAAAAIVLDRLLCAAEVPGP